MASGDQLRGERIITISDNDAVAGSPIKAASRLPVVLTLIGSLKWTMARASVACLIERESSRANPADALNRGR